MISHVESKKTKLTETENRLVAARSWVWGVMGDGGQRIPISSYKINKFWGCNAQLGDYR